MSAFTRFAVRRGAAVALAAGALACLPAAAAQADTGPYVALGDSYTAGPLVPQITGTPLLCGRSTNNYPQDVRRVITPSSFTDASCSGATTADMTQPQSLRPGVSDPPQFDALSSDDTLVTVGIGGNDAGLIGVAEECVKLDVTWPFGSRCRLHYTSHGINTEMMRVRQTEPAIAGVIQGIHERAPQAEVLAVGYPDALPQDGTTCYPIVPISKRDVAWINSLEMALNTAVRRAAEANGATYVDTFTSSIGHDACTGSNAWINGLIPTSRAFPMHPNAAGEANMAAQVEGALS